MIEVEFRGGPIDGQVRALPRFHPWVTVPFIGEGTTPWGGDPNSLDVAVAFARCTYLVGQYTFIRCGTDEGRIDRYIATVAKYDWPKPPADRPWRRYRFVPFPRLARLLGGRWNQWT